MVDGTWLLAHPWGKRFPDSNTACAGTPASLLMALPASLRLFPSRGIFSVVLPSTRRNVLVPGSTWQPRTNARFTPIRRTRGDPPPGAPPVRQSISRALTSSQTDEVHSGSSRISQSDLRLHFGLDEATQIDVVEVKWRTTQRVGRFTQIAANHFMTIKEGAEII